MHERKRLGPPSPTWDSEAVVVATIIEQGGESLMPNVLKVFNRSSDCLTDHKLVSVLQMVRSRRALGKPVDMMVIQKQLSFVEYLGDASNWYFKLCAMASTPGLADLEAERLLEESNRRSILTAIESLNEDVTDLSVVKSRIRFLSKCVDAIDADEHDDVQTVADSSVQGINLSQVILPTRKSIIGTFLKAGDVGFLYARRGVGKTLFAFELARLATLGGKLHNWKSDGGNTVLYVDCEMPWDDMVKRAHGFELDKRSDFHLLNHELLFHRSKMSINLADKSQQDAITAYLESIKANLFILDNLSTGVSRQDENKALDWEIIANWLLELRRRGIASIIVHHAGRNNEMRGTSKREDAATWVLRLDDEQSKDRLGEASMTAMFTKFRSGTPLEGEPFCIRFVDQGGLIIPQLRAANSGDVVVQWVRDGLSSAADIAQEMGISKGQVSKLASKAMRDGRLGRKGRDYFLAEEA